MPPYSPEMNPIELIFALVKRSVIDDECYSYADVAYTIEKRLNKMSGKDADGYFMKALRESTKAISS